MHARSSLITLVPLLLASAACTTIPRPALEPAGYDTVKHFTAEGGDIRVTFADNSAFAPDHRAGYNGIAGLYHNDQDSNVFVPFYAGFNLEHIFSGDTLEQFFEPRINPMVLYRKSQTEALLYQKTTPVTGVESLTEFMLVPPCYVDITFRCILHDKDYFRHGYAGFFWASYINNPQDIKIYFPGVPEGGLNEEWIAGYSETHGVKSTHRSVKDHYDLYFDKDFRATLANNYSGYRYTLPFFYGRFSNMALGFFFESNDIIRLSQSPTGGGRTNPAWDFQYIIPEPQIGKEYKFRARLMYKPFVSNDDIRNEYIRWADQ